MPTHSHAMSQGRARPLSTRGQCPELTVPLSDVGLVTALSKRLPVRLQDVEAALPGPLWGSAAASDTT